MYFAFNKKGFGEFLENLNIPDRKGAEPIYDALILVQNQTDLTLTDMHLKQFFLFKEMLSGRPLLCTESSSEWKTLGRNTCAVKRCKLR